MEKKKLLSKVSIKKTVSAVTVFVFFFTQTVLAGSFEDALSAGHSIGSSAVMQGPQQSHTEYVPFYQEAQQQRSQYESYYTNPAQASAVGQQQEITQFVYDSYTQREQIDLSEDSVFGNKCLQYETVTENGQEVKRCVMWSMSKDLLTKDYPDCEKVAIPQYEQGQIQACTSNAKIDSSTCETSYLPFVNATQVEGPCSGLDISVDSNQIYAVCRDNMELYRVNKGVQCYFCGHYAFAKSALCGSDNSRCSFCWWNCPAGYTVSSENELPPGAVFLGKGVTNVYIVGSSGSRTACGTFYDFYKVTNLSTLEKLYVSSNSSCGEQSFKKYLDECVAWDYTVCNANRANCVKIIENGQETGNTYQPECKSISSAVEKSDTQICNTQCSDMYNLCTEECKSFINCTNCLPQGNCSIQSCGSCSECQDTQNGENCSTCNNCSPYPCGENLTSSSCSNCVVQQVGQNKYFVNCTGCADSGNCAIETCSNCALCSNQQTGENCSNCSGCSPVQCDQNLSSSQCQNCEIYVDENCVNTCYGDFCQEVCSTQLQYGYNICPQEKNIIVNNRTLTETPVVETTTEPFYNEPNAITIKRLIGGPGVKETFNEWYNIITFKCKDETSNCSTLEEQGCVYVSSQCANQDCTEFLNTYKCSEDKVTGYQINYLCNNELRCIGTDCGEVSYETNSNFNAAVATSEILNMARVDSKKGANIEIFPGQAMQCMSSPENCCKPIISSVTIADFVKAGRAMIELYNVATQGFQAIGYQYASLATEMANTFAAKLGFAEATTVCTYQGEVMLTTTTVETSFGFTGTVSTTLDSGMTLSTTATVPSGTLATIGTVASVVGAVLAAYTIYQTLYGMAFQCDTSDFETATKLGYKLCHYVDQLKFKKYGFFTVRTNRYCCFNSILARIIHEQGRPQLGIPWRIGDVEGQPNCRGFTPEELSSLDFSQIDLREYLQFVERKTSLTTSEISNIEQRIKDKYRNAVEGN